MKYENLIIELNRIFPDVNPPEKVTSCATTKDLKDDFECMSIERDFAQRNRDSLSYRDCSMLIIDSALISDEAFTYFIPRLAKAVISESGDAFLLSNRLKKIKRLSREQMKLAEELIIVCDEIENEIDLNV
jgi:hypothetical protein